MEPKTSSFRNLPVTIVLLIATLLYMASLSFGTPEVVNSDELQKCAVGLGGHCGDSLYKYVFENGVQVSEKCCSRLLTVGKDCHNLLAKVIIIYNRFSDKEVKKIHRKRDQVWENCKAVAY
ncbi:hypothetical protein RND81_04G048600 [Saponaria officinalis]|uniref:Prolamin-like domain-containing protein n=1 Tax=Saponaria officinalis TaxID=3572 RepID=A0AAW1LGI2_SAPOF